MAHSDEEVSRRKSLNRMEVLKREATKAQETLDTIDRYKRSAGGVTPTQLQELTHDWGLAVDLPTLRDPIEIERYIVGLRGSFREQVYSATGDIRVWAMRAMMFMLMLAHSHSYDLYEITFDGFTEELENAVSRYERAKADMARLTPPDA